ncbi:MAG: rod shape-determining protein MreC [Bacilli bacterium]|nr:rod shape-determining protein MreC [Bacilli bacterium]
MKKNKRKKKYILFVGIGIVSIILVYFFVNDKNKFLDIFKGLSASTFYIDKDFNFNKDVLENEIKDLNNQINDLKRMNEIDNVLSDKININASIIKRSPNYWYDIITINKGKKDGVKKGFGVISNNGLIGEIITVNNHSSEVRLICNTSENYISAKFSYEGKDYYGIIKEYNLIKNELYLENVIGDLNNISNIDIVTSGLSNNIPSGILIGKIKDIKKDEFNLSNTLIITPSADFNDINLVRVVGLVGVR